MRKEWQYIIKKDEIYFTSEFRFPLHHVKQLTLDRGKAGTLWMTGGVLVLAFLAIGWQMIHPLIRVLFLVSGLSALIWGIRLNRIFQVGFVILKDPKWYEKIHVKILQTTSKEDAEEMLERIHNELKNEGMDKVRIVRTV